MLSIGKLAAGQEAYYLSAVAQGVEDYYTASGEVPGRWAASARLLGLSGEVSPEELHAVLEGRHPGTGEQLAAANRRRPGFDLTFSAPKSVSLLQGLGPPEVAGEVVAAHEAAVDAALSWLEGEVGTRAGHNGTERLASGGFIAAAFRHRTSRAGDPQLHTHVLTANLTCGPDGIWRSLDGRDLYGAGRTAGFLYEAELRAELSARLGVVWGPVRNGIAELEAVPTPVLRAFSRRRAEIEAAMAEHGASSAKAAQVAALDTRAAKDYGVAPEELVAEWRGRAQALGFGPDELTGLVHRLTPGLTDGLTVGLMDDVTLGRELTEHESTFDRRGVLRALAGRASHGATVAELEAAADGFLAGEGVVALGPGRRGEPCWSTPELLAIERALLKGAFARREGGVAKFGVYDVKRVLENRPSLGADQEAMVRGLLTSGAGVDVVVGPAGTGKTYALEACRAAWDHRGYRVLGCALAARAAAELQAGVGIPSATIDSLLVALEDPASGGLPAKAVVVVDEAGMVGTRKLAALLAHAQQAEAKVVLVGDHHQLPEIEAGGAFRALAEELVAVELTENRRQRHEPDRRALLELRRGKVERALRILDRQGRVISGATGEEVRRKMVADWLSARAVGEEVIMLATTRAAVADLNGRARALLQNAGELTGPALAVGDTEFQPGDRIMTLRNRRQLGVVNGGRGTVIAVRPEAGCMAVLVDDDRVVDLPADYVSNGYVVHAYASTIHKAQGMTCDRTLLLADDRLFLEAGYTGLSRGREANALYVVGRDIEPEMRSRLQQSGNNLDGLIPLLRRSAAKNLAASVGRGLEPAGP